MAKSKKDHSKKKNSRKTHGGDAANWVQQVVGDYPHSAQSAGSNVIQQHVPAANTPIISGGFQALSPAPIDSVVNHAVPNAPASAPILVATGGRKRSNKRKGGDVLAELAVPAVLLVANQTFGKKTGKKYFNAKKRFSRRYRKGRK